MGVTVLDIVKLLNLDFDESYNLARLVLDSYLEIVEQCLVEHRLHH